jgi:hypothetical protein
VTCVDIRPLVSTSAAATQELALEHASQAMQLTQMASRSTRDTGQHRLQVSDAHEALRDAFENLGPVEAEAGH